MSCCWSRGAAEGLLPPSKDSDFDKLLLEGFARILDRGGVVRSSPSALQRRCLSGTMGLVAQFSQEHFGKKRKSTASVQQVVAAAADPEAFNFNKASPAEKIAEVQAFPDGGSAAGLTTVLANLSPLSGCHVLLVPSCEQVLPQVLTEEHFLCGLHLLAKSARRDFRLFFNSLLGFASVNHFHWHGLYLNQCGLSDGRLPIEKVERSVVAGAVTEGRASVELLVETQWYARAFVLAAGCRPGTEGARPPADLAALARLAHSVAAELQRRNIPHNVILAPPVERRRKQEAANSGMAHEEEAKPNALSPEVYIVPRQPEDSLREDAGFHAAVLEIAGLVTASSEEAYRSFSEESLRDIFRTDVTMPEAVFDELICKVAWLPT